MPTDTKNTLWQLTRGQRRTYGAAVGVMGLSIAFLFCVPLITQAAIDGVLGEEENWLSRATDGATSALWLAAALVVVVTAFGGLCHYFRGRWAAQASEAIVRRLRDRLHDHIGRLECAYLDRADTGDLVQRCTSDVETVRTFLAAQVIEIGRAVLLIAIMTPILFALDARMALISLALFPLIIAWSLSFFRRIKSLFQQMDEAEGRMTTVLQENLTGIRVVRAFARQDWECEKFAQKNAAFRDYHNRLMRLLGSFWATSDLICLCQVGLVLIYGAWWTQQNAAFTVGSLFAFLQYVLLVIWPVRHMGRVLSETGKAVVALTRLREILSEPEEQDEEAIADLTSIRGEIVVDGLSFAYAEGESALDDVSFRIGAGETLALIGAPGSGKSTLIQVLLRLYDYERGSITIDGRELKSMSRAFVRSQIGVVLQEPFLYSKTLAANIRVGHSHASRDEIAGSAAAACVHDAIEEFEDGYDTVIGERGVTLSGGQRQRVAIARALLKNPPILVLDDSLSAVDTKTESSILASLRERTATRTTIVIAHRLSSVRDADRIIVLDRGRVVQSGTHEQLLEEDGAYRRLWEIQGAIESEITRDTANLQEATARIDASSDGEVR